MSIAALSSSFASAVQRSAAAVPPSVVDAAEPVRAAPRMAREQGRRHELVAAMNQALGLEPAATADRHTEQAVFRFAHALMHDLRTMVGQEGDAPPAWGRRDWGDLAQRLQALATAAGGGTATAAPADEVPDAPHPLTTTTAAVHIMKVPTSRLLEAFVSMQRALDQESDALQADSDAARTALADLVKRIGSALAPAASTRPTLPAGAVLDVSA